MMRVLFVMVVAAAVGVMVALFAYGLRDASANTFTVTSGADPGNGVCDATCTLREALTAANLSAGHDVIDFDPGIFPPGAPVAISPSSALPASADPAGITIDGSGAGVIIDGGLLGGSEHGLVIQSSNATTSLTDVTIRSVTVQNFPGHGIFVCGGAAADCDESISDVQMEDVVSGGNGERGIYIRGATTVADVEIRQSRTNGNAYEGISVAGGTTARTTIADGTSSNNGRYGIIIAGFIADNADSEVRNTVTNSNESQGIGFCCFDMIRPVVADVTSTGNKYQNIDIVGESVVDGRIENCVANGSQLFDGIRVAAAVQNLTISHCDANDNGGLGVEVIAYDDFRMIDGASISDISATNNGDSGIHVEATDSTLTDLLLDDVEASGNGNYGVQVRGGESVTDVELRNATTNGNGYQGTSVAGGVNTRTVVTNVTSSNNNNVGFNLAGFITDIADAQITGVIANSNGGQGISFCCFDMIRPVVANATAIGNKYQNIAMIGESVIDGRIENCHANGSQQDSGIAVIADISNVTIEGCEANDNATEGVRLWAYGTRQIDGAAISNVHAGGNGTDGIDVTGEDQVSGVSLVSNTLAGNVATGIETANVLDMHFNRIFGNGVGLNNLSGLPLDAENNWWGCNLGPDNGGCDSALGAVDADPWLRLDLMSDPDPAFGMSSAELTASLVRNSDGADTSGDGHIQDGTVIGFTTDMGSLPGTGTDAPTVSGNATATLHTDDEGIAHLTASLDNETVMLSLTILGPAPSPTATPTATPGAELIQGDNDCDADVDAVDALQGLRFLAGLDVNQAPGCPGIGSEVASLFGDVDCDGDVDAVDALQILRFVAGLPVSQAQGCPGIGVALA